MKDKSKKGMTLDKLAGMVARGFRSVDKRFERLETMATTMATKEEMNNRFNDVDKRFDKVDMRLDDVERKIDKVDFRVDQVYEIVDQGEKDFLNLRKRVQVLEKVVKTP